jgi:hypothetical protein
MKAKEKGRLKRNEFGSKIKTWKKRNGGIFKIFIINLK